MNSPMHADYVDKLIQERGFLSYRQVLEFIKNLPEENLDDSFTVYGLQSDESFGLIEGVTPKDWETKSYPNEFQGGILDDNHPFLISVF